MPESHVHRWRLEEPNGASQVEGRCACGAVRRFPVSIDAVLEARGVGWDRAGYPRLLPSELPSALRLREWRDW